MAMLLAFVMLAGCLFGCVVIDDDPAEVTEEPAEEDEEEEAEDEPATEAFVAKIAGEPIYSSEFYYFLYQGLREYYYQADIYDENLTDDENLTKMREYFESENEDGVTYKQLVADRTLQIAQGFKISYMLGKKASESNEEYQISEEYLESVLSYIDSEADYGASVYGCTRDEYFFYAYGMNVNDAKRYTEQQLYSEIYESVWAEDNGYVVGMDEPEEPEEPSKPSEPADDADEATITQYNADLEAYNTQLAAYESELEAYNENVKLYETALAAYWEKFRDEYNENIDSFAIKTVRTLYISTLDDEGEALTGDALEEKNALADKYLKLVTEQGLSFESVVKGFSESGTASSDLGLTDVDIYDGELGDLTDEVITWVIEQSGLSEKPEIIECDGAIYIVAIEGITDFDGTDGVAADASSTTYELVRSNVEYSLLAELYNAFIEERMAEDEYQLTDVDNEAMLTLTTEYLNYTGDIGSDE